MHFRLKSIIIVIEWSHQNARSVVITILVRANSRQNTPRIFNNDTGKRFLESQVDIAHQAYSITIPANRFQKSTVVRTHQAYSITIQANRFQESTVVRTHQAYSITIPANSLKSHQSPEHAKHIQ